MWKCSHILCVLFLCTTLNKDSHVLKQYILRSQETVCVFAIRDVIIVMYQRKPMCKFLLVV